MRPTWANGPTGNYKSFLALKIRKEKVLKKSNQGREGERGSVLPRLILDLPF